MFDQQQSSTKQNGLPASCRRCRHCNKLCYLVLMAEERTTYLASMKKLRALAVELEAAVESDQLKWPEKSVSRARFCVTALAGILRDRAEKAAEISNRTAVRSNRE
jgi:hypothetical protein